MVQELLAQLEQDGKVTLDLGSDSIELDNEDIQVRLQAKEGWAAAQGSGSVVVLSTELTDELIHEGYARDLVRMIQDRRKETQCEYTDRIDVCVIADSDALVMAIAANRDYICQETLADSLVCGAAGSAAVVEFRSANPTLAEHTATIGEHAVALFVVQTG